ncbi:ESF1-like [Solea senegalensis]|nr:ESF1 homolog [Solea senegalensis]KAG7453687.1 ESF1-like [Solea senegalensis]
MSSQKKKKPRSGDGGGDDQRFLRVQKDPRFWEMPEREHKVKIDKRFQSMFHDKRFKVTYTVDKRGRPVNHTSTDNLRRFYKLSDSEDEEEEEEVKEKKKEEVVKDEKKEKTAESSDEDSDDELQQTEEDDDDDDDEEEEESETGSGSEGEEEESGLDSEEDSDSGPDLARGKGNVDTSSDEDEDDDVSALLRKEEEEIQHDWGELCKDAQRSEEVSARLAVCNMDWDRMKARDLLALCNSFSPKGGAVLSVKIYPSEFGKERLKTEETRGPVELKVLPEDSEEDTEEDRTYREKKRDYQFKRLKYFYAVVECDSVVTATKIYEECDGYEYESSCSVLDLRFIPDDVTFTDEPTDVATDVNLSTYTPKLFTSSATATSKVELTWDETDHERVTALNRKFNKDELLQMDFQAYLASSSEEEEDEEQATRGQEEGETIETQDEEDDDEEEEEEKKKKTKTKSEEQMCKYRELLRGIHDKEKQQQQDKDMEMEITWVPGLKETTEQLVKKKLEGRDKLTPWEEFLEKKKERRKQKKTKRTTEAADDDLSDDELPVGVDLSDPFFADEIRDTDVKKKQKKEKKTTTKKKEEEPTAEEEELEKRKAEMSLLMDDDDADEHKHFNYDKIVERQNLSKKKKKKLLKKGEEPLEDDAFQVDVADPRFQAMFSSHLFNLDPSHPSYKKTKATQSIEAEKQRQRAEQQRRREDGLAMQTATPTRTVEAEQGRDSVTVATKRAMEPSLSLLVKSIKNKTQQFQDRKKPKLS